jgi:N-acyl-D-amino-acid deacylase
MTLSWIGLAVVLMQAQPTAAEKLEADYVIRNVELYDGTGTPPQRGDLAVRGERIVGMGVLPELAGSPRIIDGQKLVAAPGFIDLHNHSDSPITKPQTRLNQNFLTQGVTTIVTGNCGGGRADVGAYLQELDQHGAGTHVVHLIPQGSLRAAVMGEAKRPATPNELEAMKRLTAQAMKDGAWGMSSGLIYVPSKYADQRELTELARVVANHGGLYASHIRNEGVQLLEAIEEALEIGRAANCPVHLSHFKASGQAAWGLATEGLRKVQAARDAGQRVTADQYPYIASSTSLAAMVVPDEYRDVKRFRQALQTPAEADWLRKEIEKAIETRSGGASLFVASYKHQPAWQGRDLATLAQQEKKSPFELVVEIQTHGGASMVHFGMEEGEVRLIMRQPFVATASDGGAKVPDDTVPHPRNYGTFPRKIGLYAIEGQQLTLEAAIRSCSGLPADILGMQDRGYLRAGLVADIVLFDPQTFRDTATYEKPHQYAPGVQYLFVNGQLAIDQGQVTGKLAGRPLRSDRSQDAPDAAASR